MPVRIVRDVIFDLERAGLIAPILSPDEKTNFYIPGPRRAYAQCFRCHPPGSDDRAIESEKHSGSYREALWKDPLDIGMSSEYREINTILDNMDRITKNSPYNILLMDIAPAPNAANMPGEDRKEAQA